jgi:type IV pilus assembly protein PilY1
VACPDTGTCSVSNAACTNNAQCPTIAGGCSLNGQACTINAQCGLSGTCSINPTVCANDAQCPLIPGLCSTSGLGCTVNANCPTLPGQCSISLAACTIQNCPTLGQTCSITGLGCNPGVCPTLPGTCSIQNLVACTANADCLPVVTPGACSITLTACTTNAQCLGVGSPSGGAVCSDMQSDNVRSLFQDANLNGVVCRHNNKLAGPGYGSGPYDYPNATYKIPVTAGVGANACVASARYATVPRHYWKTGVEWCDFAIGGAVLATPKWLGYGDRSQGTCQDAQDTTHIYPRFYQFGQPPATDNDLIPAFRRTDLIVGATYTHDWTDAINGPQTITRTYVEEMTNYANWFAYYRTRIQALKTVTSGSFAQIDAKYRVGFHAMFSLPSFLNVADFDAVQKPAWFTKLFGVTIPLGQETPTLTAVTRIGDYFKDGTHAQLAGSTDPITLSCQQNFHMLFTDGFTNQGALPITQVSNVDDVVPNAPPFAGFPVGLVANPIVGLTQGVAWPRPYREDTLGSASNALSDYAMAYWVTDLRPGMIDNVPTDNTPPLAGDRYSAKWQHLNFAALSLGTTGKLPAGNQVATELALRNPIGTLQWPQPIPTVNKPDNSGVDDLWHAAMNGHGDFVNASSIEEVKLGIGKILAGVTNLPGTRTSVGFVSNSFGASANFLYRVRFEQGWSGSLTKLQIDPTTGVPLAQPPIWDASAQLTAVTTPPAGWLNGRRIVTMNEAGTRIPFLWASLGANQKDSLAPGRPLKGQAILEFLRGNRAKEGGNVGQLRVRLSPMGDIVDSSPVYVGPPNAPYLDANDPGYSGFKSGPMSTRAPQLYVGGNDGMLHVFDDASGNESWAYVPTPLFRGGSATALPPVPNDPRTGLGALAYQDGALPPFRHHYYVDLTPKIVDVDLNAPNGNQWRTLLVGGLGKGGNRYYALNATDPAAVTDEATAKNQILWEFPPVGDTTIDMGYTFGKPMIAKTRGLFPIIAGSGKGAWLAIVGSGYNNPTGVGKLYFLQASDPTNYKVMSTGVGNPGSPAGLAHPAGYTQDFQNQLAEQIYSGDLLGNLWRFDVSDPTSDTNWPAPGQYAKLIPPSGIGVQPVTTPPEIKIDMNNGIDRWVFVGTGKLYDDTDLADNQLQTMYGFRDGTAQAPWALPATPIDRTTVGMVPLPSLNPTNNFGLATAPAKGWFDDLPAGSRIVVAPQAAFGVLAYIATKPLSADLCATGLPVTLYAREYGTGQSVLTANPDGSGPIVFGLDIAQGGVGLQIVTFEPAAGSSTPDVRLAITMPDGTVRYFKPKLPSAFFQHRMSWRLLGQ